MRSTIRSYRQGIGRILTGTIMHFPSQSLRIGLLRFLGAKIGAGSVLYAGTEVLTAANLTIGKGTSIGHRCMLDARGGLKLGHAVNLSTEVWVWTAEHDITSSSFAMTCAPVEIHDYAWLGGRVIVMPGVVIGKGAVIASGAVVTKSVPPFEIHAGIPARKIGMRQCEPNYTLGSCMPFI